VAERSINAGSPALAYTDADNQINNSAADASRRVIAQL
jgi:hypothetical protein